MYIQVFSELKRLKRLCERDNYYLEALNVLKGKSLNSYFCKDLVVDMLEITKQWKERFGPPKNNKKQNIIKENISIWTTNFPNLLKPTKKENQLNQNTMITYKRHNTLATLLINYKIIALQLNAVKGISYPVGKCMLSDRGGN